MEVASEMQVDVFHRHDLGVAAASRATLHAEARAERRLAQCNDGLLADLVQAVAQADRRGGLAFARWCRVDGGDEDQLAVRLGFQRVDIRQCHLGLGVAVGNQIRLRNAQLLADLHDRFHLGFAGNLNVALNSHGLPQQWRLGGAP